MSKTPTHRGTTIAYIVCKVDQHKCHHILWSCDRSSSHPIPLVHVSWKTILAISETGDKNPRGREIWPWPEAVVFWSLGPPIYDLSRFHDQRRVSVVVFHWIRKTCVSLRISIPSVIHSSLSCLEYEAHFAIGRLIISMRDDNSWYNEITPVSSSVPAANTSMKMLLSKRADALG